MTKITSLDATQIAEIKDLCAKIAKKGRQNQQTVVLAKGISEYVDLQEVISLKQSQWLLRNCLFWKLPKPDVLADISLDVDKTTSNAPNLKEAFANLIQSIKQTIEQAERLCQQMA